MFVFVQLKTIYKFIIFYTKSVVKKKMGGVVDLMNMVLQDCGVNWIRKVRQNIQ